KQQEPANGADDLRGFEWYYWNRAAGGAPAALPLDGLDVNPTVSAVGYSSDGKRLVAAGWNGLAFIWNAETRARERTLIIGDGNLRTLAIDPKYRWIAFGGDRAVTIVNPETGETIRKF